VRREIDLPSLGPEPPAGVPTSSESRSELIARLFAEHNDALIRFLALRLRSQQEAKEVAQEAYVRLLSLDQPGAVGFLRAFLFKTAANLAVDRIRHQQTTQHAARSGKLFEDLGEPSPEQLAASAQDMHLLEKLIDELPPKCRRAFLLHTVHGLEFAQIAAQMGLRERMVRTYIVRATVYCRAGLDAVASAGTVERHKSRDGGGKGHG
jgi:RNA polymerase sigma factor (sigma-70 family)